jgi:glycosidase
MKDIATWWLEQGVDGFRLDAVPHVYGTAELPNNEPGLGKTLDWWEEFRDHCRSVNPDVLLVGEVLDRMAVRLPFAESFDSVFHVDLGEAIAQAVKGGGSRNDYLAGLMERELGQYRDKNPEFLNTPFLSNHDQNRIYGLVGGNPDRMKLAASLYILSEGLPFVYYGEEIGMFGSKPDEDIRLPFVWGEETVQTSWRTSRYTKVVPVFAQTTDQDSLLTHYRRLIQLKTAHPSLYEGQLKAVIAKNPAIVSWRMDAPTETALVLHNLSLEPVSFTPSASGPEDGWQLVFEHVPGTSGLANEAILPAGETLTLHPQSTLVLVRKTGGMP